VGPRVGLDDEEKRKFSPITGLELRPLGRPASSQSLYRLRYLGYLTPRIKHKMETCNISHMTDFICRQFIQNKN
jgi:hypothetical protein